MSSAEKEVLERLESKVEKLTDAVTKLVLIEERQLTQGQRIGALEDRMTTAEAQGAELRRNFDSWLNKAIGAISIISMLFMVLNSRFFEKILGGP